jgi:peptidoglycan/LPS O-acetylase OafA/YrhL
LLIAGPQTLAPSPYQSGTPGGFRHVPALDGIRGLAILLVLIDHLMASNARTGSRLFDTLSEIRTSSYCGVNLFFALSGFLITGILFDSLDLPRYFTRFYARRALRIFPLYYGVILGLLILTGSLHFAWSGWQYYFLTYTQNLAVWRDSTTLKLGFFNINHFWSLQVEEQFYLIWPLIIYKLRQPEKIVRISLIGCAIIFAIRVFLVAMRAHPAFHNKYLTYSPTFSCADNILFGCCLCALLRTRWRETTLRAAPWVLAASAGTLAITAIENSGLDWSNNWFVPTFGFTLIAISCSAAIAMAQRPASKTQRFFSNDILRFLGKYSYGIYIFHYSLHGALTRPIRLFLNDHGHSKALSVIVTAAVVGILSVLVAMLSYHLFEIHFLRLKMFFRYDEAAAGDSSPQHAQESALTLAREFD